MCTNWYICLTSNCDIFVSHNHIMHKSSIFGPCPLPANMSLLNLDQSIFFFFMWTAEQLLRNKVAFHPFANTTEPIKMCVVCNIIMLTLFYSFGRRCQLPRWIIMELCTTEISVSVQDADIVYSLYDSEFCLLLIHWLHRLRCGSLLCLTPILAQNLRDYVL